MIIRNQYNQRETRFDRKIGAFVPIRYLLHKSDIRAVLGCQRRRRRRSIFTFDPRDIFEIHVRSRGRFVVEVIPFDASCVSNNALGAIYLSFARATFLRSGRRRAAEGTKCAGRTGKDD
jgi:hypothetical protein